MSTGGGRQTGSGTGFGQRDVDFEFRTPDAAEAFKAGLVSAGIDGLEVYEPQ